jgi:transposase
MKSKGQVKFPVVNAHAAGIDVGSREHFVCVGLDKEEDIRSFSSFTYSLHELANWLKLRGVKSIAMESTGIYWRALFVLLQNYGFEVILVNSSHTKNVSGKKTDMQDCQWIWKLHEAGLLHGSFQPDEFSEQLRVFSRRRKSLIEESTRSVNRMQKVLVLMNLHLPVVLSDIMGKSGKAIISAILEGQRDGMELAKLADYRVKASTEEIAQALTGWWQEPLLFELQQCWDMFNFQQSQIAKCDEKIEELLAQKVIDEGLESLAYEPEIKKRIGKNDPSSSIDQYAFQLSEGVDLMAVDGVGRSLVLTLLAETGLNLKKKFPTEKHYASWLGLCPNKKTSGGKVISSKTKKMKNYCAIAYRQAALNLSKKKNCVLAKFFNNVAYRIGRQAAITATARKLAVIIYKMLETKRAFDPVDLTEYLERIRQMKIKGIQKAINKLKIHEQELVFA